MSASETLLAQHHVSTHLQLDKKSLDTIKKPFMLSKKIHGDDDEPFASIAFEDVGLVSHNVVGLNAKLGGPRLYKSPKDHAPLLAHPLLISFVILALSALVYMQRLGYIDSVVFDEVHFGGMSNRYITGTFYYDLHPPLAKFIFAFIGYLKGYWGNFTFANIHMSFTNSLHTSALSAQHYPGIIDAHNAPPYFAYRFASSLFGFALPLLGYLTAKELGSASFGAVFAAMALLLETTFITQSRHIFLDSPMVFFSSLAIYFFYKTRNSTIPFSKKWKWHLFITGIALGCSISVKWIALFTMFSLAIQTLYDLWTMVLDADISFAVVKSHFWYKCLYLLCLPLAIYFFLYAIHIHLMRIGNQAERRLYPTYGDYLAHYSSPPANLAFVYPTTQFNLRNANRDIMGPDFTKAATSRYQYRFLPAIHPDAPTYSADNKVEFFSSPIRHQSIVYIVDAEKDHCISLSDLKIDSTPKNAYQALLSSENCEAFQITFIGAPNIKDLSSLAPKDEDDDDNEDNNIEDTDNPESDSYDFKEKELRSKRDSLRAWRPMGSEAKPEVALSHLSKSKKFSLYSLEKKCNLKLTFSSLTCVEGPEVVADDNSSAFLIDDPFQVYNIPNRGSLLPPKKKMGFFRLLHTVIIHNIRAYISNSNISGKHTYQSYPMDWILLRKGTSYWQNKPNNQQIFLLGNPFIYWSCLGCLAVFTCFMLAIFFREKRLIFDLVGQPRERLHLIFMLYFCYAANMAPFLGLSRQLFLHHYLNAHYVMILALACSLDLLLETRKSSLYLRSLLLAIFFAVFFYGYWKFFPLTYGTPMPAGFKSLHWLKTWKFFD